MQISSVHNPSIKQILSLSKSGKRKKENLFIIEGLREIKRAYENKVEIISLYYCTEKLSTEAAKWLSDISHDRYEVTGAVYSKVAYRENVDGIIAMAKPWNVSIENLLLSKNPLILVLESIEKPGNLGAILRTADAAGLDAIIICDPQTDIFNPNVIRSSIGCLFSKQLAVCDSEAAIEFLKSKKIRIYSAVLQDSIPFTDVDYKNPTAIILGSEADGLSAKWRKNADQKIKIPMQGIADSLNVSVSAAVIVFEAVRQRR